MILSETEDEAKKVCSVLKKKGIRWYSGKSLDITNWKGNNICYILRVKSIGKIGLKFATGRDYRDYKVISSSEFIKNNVSILDISNRIYNENK